MALVTNSDLAKQIALEELELILGASGGVLKESQAIAIAAFAGCSPRQVYRLRAAILKTMDDQELNLIERLNTLGKRGFVLDDVWWTLYYWSVGRANRVLEALDHAGYGERLPDAGTVSKRMQHAPEALVKGAREGLRNRHKRFLYSHLDAVDVDEVLEADEYVVDLDLGPLVPDSDPLVLHVDALVDRRSNMYRAVAGLPHAFCSSDWLALVGAACETFVDSDNPDRLLGGMPKHILFDNAGQFTATRNDEVWNQIAELDGPTPALLIPHAKPLRTPVPDLGAHAPYWWTSKPHVEAGSNRLQSELEAFVPGRKTTAHRLDGTDAHSVGDKYLFGFNTGVGLLLRTVEKLNHRYMPALDATPAEYYAANKKTVEVLPDAALAKLYQPHYFRDGIRTVIPDKGVQIDGEWWTGDGLDFDFLSDWRAGKGALRPRQGDKVEVRVTHHRNNPAYYLPKRGADGKLIPVDVKDPGPLGRRQDRAAIMFDGNFTGWVYPGATPPAVRERIVLNRIATTSYIQRLQRSSRDAAKILGRLMEDGEDDLAAIATMTVDTAVTVATDATATEEAIAASDRAADRLGAAALGQDVRSADDPHRPPKRNPTRTSGKRGAKRPPVTARKHPGLDALADAADAADAAEFTPDADTE